MIYTLYIIPVMIIIIGFWMNKYPPKKINWIVGYRTIKSMKDKESWEFANRYCGKLWIKIGIIMLVLSVILHIVSYFNLVIFSETLLDIIVLLQVVPLPLSAFVVEGKIKNGKV